MCTFPAVTDVRCRGDHRFFGGEGGLACTVSANQADTLPALYLDRHAVKQFRTAERKSYILQTQ